MMKKHLTDGELRAALDEELEHIRLQHLKSCPDCQRRQQQLNVERMKVSSRLAFLRPGEEPVPSAQAAWNRFSQKTQEKEISMVRRLFSIPMIRYGTAALALLTLILAFPSTRALAGELLSLWTSPAWSN
jgi:anti-sigma factor RsiW